MHTLTKALAVELGGDRIRVCAIAPVATDTPLLPSFLGPGPGMREKFTATVPLGRLAQVQDIANTALFLASDDAEFVDRQYRRGRRRPLRLRESMRPRRYTGCLENSRVDGESAIIAGFLASARLYGSFLSPQALVYPYPQGKAPGCGAETVSPAARPRRQRPRRSKRRCMRRAVEAAERRRRRRRCCATPN